MKTLFFTLTFLLLTPLSLFASDDGPVVSITSPVIGHTFAGGEIKFHQLMWFPKTHALVARITFTNELHAVNSNVDEDDIDFPIPGVAFDPGTKLFYVTLPNGDVIPVARSKKILFTQDIKTLPNAAVRLIYKGGGDVSLILEAIYPKDVKRFQDAHQDTGGSFNLNLSNLFHG